MLEISPPLLEEEEELLEDELELEEDDELDDVGAMQQRVKESSQVSVIIALQPGRLFVVLQHSIGASVGQVATPLEVQV